MSASPPLILIASHSANDRQQLERALGEAGSLLQPVEDAEQAARACAGRERRSVLVIDAGLLEMTRDTRWRDLRERHRDLGLVVRCLVPRGELRRVDRTTFHVHPDDEEGLREAVRLLGSAEPPGR